MGAADAPKPARTSAAIADVFMVEIVYHFLPHAASAKIKTFPLDFARLDAGWRSDEKEDFAFGGAMINNSAFSAWIPRTPRSSGTGLRINIESIEIPFGDIERGAKVFNVGEAVFMVFNVKNY